MKRPNIALFGITPLSLLIGRACCLADNPPVGLYDVDPSRALEGALFLGISARKEPDRLDPPSERLDIAILGSLSSASGLERLTANDNLLVISLLSLDSCHDLDRRFVLGLALPEPMGDPDLSYPAISASVPELSFQLQGPTETQRRIHHFLSSLSARITCRYAL